MDGGRRIWARVGVIAGGSLLWRFLPSGLLWGQTVEELESALKVKRGLEETPGEPVMSLFTLVTVVPGVLVRYREAWLLGVAGVMLLLGR